MNTKNKHSLNNPFIVRNKAKDTKYYPYGSKIKAVFEAFTGTLETMLQAQNITGIKRTTICRYIGLFCKKGIVTTVYKAPCEISKHKAKYFKIV